MRIKVVEGTSLVWKLDTDAVNACIKEDAYFNIFPEVRSVLEHVHMKFHSADENELKILGTAKMILSFGDRHFISCFCTRSSLKISL